jgi:hypothetical protein
MYSFHLFLFDASRHGPLLFALEGKSFPPQQRSLKPGKDWVTRLVHFVT